ncbi:MAG TPA: N-acetylmuramoyl-L-alanine amidase [Sandaracinaceae bacterium]
MSVRQAWLAALLLLGACAQEPTAAPDPTDPEQIPEVQVTRLEIDEHWSREGGYLVSPPLDAPTGATRVGALVTLASPGDSVVLEARGLAGRSEASWLPLEETWAEGDQLVARVDLGFVADGAQLRIREDALPRISGITWSAVVPVPEEPLPLIEEDDVGLTRAPLRAELAAAGVIARESWGARATRCTATDSSKSRMAIHHTATPATSDPPTRLRGIQAYHMDTNGWCDIGYHFLISLDGRVWEGRPIHLLGAHVANHNTGNIGICLIGCFHTSGCSDWTPFTPPDAMIDATGNLVRVLSGLFGITVTAETVKGHRDHAGATTACPGDNLHALLGRIRSTATAPTTPQFRAQYVHQTFPLARDPFELRPNEEVFGYIEMRNTGTETWEPGRTFLGTTEPRDGASPIAGPDWISPNRAATVHDVVPPGSSGRFEFTVRAPLTPGDYPQYFNLVQEGVAWFGDPGQGGPPDNQLQVRVTVLDLPPVGGEDAGPSTSPDAGLPTTEPDAGTSEPDAGPGGPLRPPGVSGCGCRASTADDVGPWTALAIALLLPCRRRRRARPS